MSKSNLKKLITFSLWGKEEFYNYISNLNIEDMGNDDLIDFVKNY